MRWSDGQLFAAQHRNPLGGRRFWLTAMLWMFCIQQGCPPCPAARMRTTMICYCSHVLWRIHVIFSPRIQEGQSRAPKKLWSRMAHRSCSWFLALGSALLSPAGLVRQRRKHGNSTRAVRTRTQVVRLDLEPQTAGWIDWHPLRRWLETLLWLWGSKYFLRRYDWIPRVIEPLWWVNFYRSPVPKHGSLENIYSWSQWNHPRLEDSQHLPTWLFEICVGAGRVPHHSFYLMLDVCSLVGGSILIQKMIAFTECLGQPSLFWLCYIKALRCSYYLIPWLPQYCHTIYYIFQTNWSMKHGRVFCSDFRFQFCQKVLESSSEGLTSWQPPAATWRVSTFNIFQPIRTCRPFLAQRPRRTLCPPPCAEPARQLDGGVSVGFAQRPSVGRRTVTSCSCRTAGTSRWVGPGPQKKPDGGGWAKNGAEMGVILVGGGRVQAYHGLPFQILSWYYRPRQSLAFRVPWEMEHHRFTSVTCLSFTSLGALDRVRPSEKAFEETIIPSTCAPPQNGGKGCSCRMMLGSWINMRKHDDWQYEKRPCWLHSMLHWSSPKNVKTMISNCPEKMTIIHYSLTIKAGLRVLNYIWLYNHYNPCT